ncbi:MAG: citramalate synthase [Bacteroidota bacterium]
MLYDTTLRDGTQGEGISFSARDKVLLAKKMDAFGIDYIEGGWPGSNPRDMEFFNLVREEHFDHAKITAFGSTRRAQTDVYEDPQIQMLLDADTPVVTIFGKSWLLHVTEVIKTTPETNLEMIRDSVSYLKSKDKEVIYDAEHFFDGYKDNSDYALQTLDAALKGGADFIVLCDTNGGTQVKELELIVSRVIDKFPDSKIGVHCHNDCGLGVALSIAGVEAGASMVQATMNGFGERVGNANLTSIIANLQLKLSYNLNCADHLPYLKEFSDQVDTMAHRLPDNQKPFVGKSAFAHKGGVHANAAKKVARSYEHIRPELVGNEQRILLSDMAGGSSVAMKARKMGVLIDEKAPQMKDFLANIKTLENEGHEFENADASFYVLLHEHFFDQKDILACTSYHLANDTIAY